MSSNHFMVVSDPKFLETRFSTNKRLKSKKFVESNYDLEIEDIQPFLEQIPSREADFLELYYMMEKNQAEIATIFKVCQGTVCHRLKKAVSRIRFLLSLPKVIIEDMRTDLSLILPDRDVNILIEMYRKTCQSQVALELGLSQCYVRHRFLQSIEKLKEHIEDDVKYEEYVEIFSSIKDNFNILREIKLPRWSRSDRILDGGSEYQGTFLSP